jgi:hypothetical protein
VIKGSKAKGSSSPFLCVPLFSLLALLAITSG